jgi:hypothetical protein
MLATQLSAEDGARCEEAIRAMDAIRHVARGLAFWLGGVGLLKLRAPDIVWVGHTPSLNQDFEALKEITGLPQECRLPEDERDAHIRPPTEDVSLDPPGRANLRLWYRHDYRILQHCLDALVPGAPRRSLAQGDPWHRYSLQPPFDKGTGYSWTSALPPALHAQDPAARAPLVLLEDDRKLLPGSAMHLDVCTLGGGAHAFWKDKVCFSTSDGTDPNLNNRTYAVEIDKSRLE